MANTNVLSVIEPDVVPETFPVDVNLDFQVLPDMLELSGAEGTFAFHDMDLLFGFMNGGDVDINDSFMQ